MLRALAVLLILLAPLGSCRAASEASDRRARLFVQRYWHGDFAPGAYRYYPPMRTGSSRRPLTGSEGANVESSLVAAHMDAYTYRLWKRLLFH